VAWGGTGDVTVATDQTSYTRNQSLSVKAIVRSGGVTVANTRVNFTVKKSNGALVTGTAIYKLRLTKKGPVGNYLADTGAMSTSAATNFMVQ
jgi:hypothetical protein